ncbi:DNA repair protein RecO [bacterium]|nr:DNA repair protein RecO [bacterium]
MQPLKQDAIVLGGVDYSDTSRVIWVLTPDAGRQSLMVKGARRPRSKFQGCLETFSRVSLIYRKAAHGAMPTLREADPLAQRPGLRESLEAFLAASEAVEAIKSFSEPDQESTALFGLLDEFLVLCDLHGREHDFLRLARLAFRWRLAAVLGLEPQLVECVRCGQPHGRRSRYRFVIAEGGLLCPECEPSRQDQDYAPEGGLDYAGLRFLYRSLRRLPAGPDDLQQAPDEDSLRELERLARRYFAYHVGELPAAREGLSWNGPSTGGA